MISIGLGDILPVMASRHNLTSLQTENRVWDDICLMFGSIYRSGLCVNQIQIQFQPSRKTLINNL